MGKVSKKTKREVADLLKQLKTTNSARESADIAQQIKQKVEQATAKS